MKFRIALFSMLAGPALAQPVMFDLNTKYITIPVIQVGTQVFTNVTLRLDTINVIKADPVVTSITAAEKCASTNFSAAKFAAISLGMTFDQVTATMGCKPDPTQTYRGLFNTSFVWQSTASYSPNMTVYFDVSGSKVDYLYQNSTNPFKTGSGF